MIFSLMYGELTGQTLRSGVTGGWRCRKPLSVSKRERERRKGQRNDQKEEKEKQARPAASKEIRKKITNERETRGNADAS